MAYKEINLDLSDEHRVLKQSVRDFGLEVLRPAAIALDQMPHQDVVRKDSLFHDCMKRMYEHQYHTTLLPDSIGGCGLDPLGQHIFFEEMGYGSVGFGIAIGVAQFPAFFAAFTQNPVLIEKWVLPYTACRDASIMGCWGITEPNHGSDNLAHGTEFFTDPKITQQVKAVKEGNQWIINGQKSAWVSCGPTANQVALFVGIDGSMGMAGGGICIVNLDAPGVMKGTPLNKIGQRDLPQGELFFENVAIPEEDMLLDQHAYEMGVFLTLSHANAAMGAMFTGVAQSALDLALEHCTHRTQGGKLLFVHQAVKKKLFDMFMKVETARAMSRAAMSYNYSADIPDLKYSITSKVYCTQAAFDVANEAVQLFGGYGLTKEYPIEKIFRDARAGLIEDGSNDVLSIVAGNMLAQEAMP